MARYLIWVVAGKSEGWGCSQCQWTCSSPALLEDQGARTAYDRIAALRFREHACGDHPAREQTRDVSFSERARNLVMRGFKPKDAVDLVLQELRLEFRHDPRAIQAVEEEAEDFLRRLREGRL
jgi:uncharacterized protein YoaH (UPF0181 family)